MPHRTLKLNLLEEISHHKDILHPSPSNLDTIQYKAWAYFILEPTYLSLIHHLKSHQHQLILFIQ